MHVGTPAPLSVSSPLGLYPYYVWVCVCSPASTNLLNPIFVSLCLHMRLSLQYKQIKRLSALSGGNHLDAAALVIHRSGKRVRDDLPQRNRIRSLVSALNHR